MFICASFQAPSHTILQVYDELPIVLPLPITSPFSVFQIPIISMYIIHIGILYIYPLLDTISRYMVYIWSTWIILDTILRLCIYVIRPQFAIYDDINVMSIHHHPPHVVRACSMYLPSVSIKRVAQARSSWRIRTMCSPWSHRPGLMDLMAMSERCLEMEAQTDGFFLGSWNTYNHIYIYI